MRKVNKHVTLGEEKGLRTPSCGDSVYTVKKIPYSDGSRFDKFDVFPEIIMESRFPANMNREEIADSPSRLEVTPGESNEWKTVSLKSSFGPRDLNEIIVSEEAALATVVHFFEKEYEKARNHRKEAEEAEAGLLKLYNGFKSKDSLDFDTPGKAIEIEVPEV